MHPRQVFAPVLATVLIAITAAWLHPGLDLSPLLDIEPQGGKSATPAPRMR